jgi:hypothetical protein
MLGRIPAIRQAENDAAWPPSRLEIAHLFRFDGTDEGGIDDPHIATVVEISANDIAALGVQPVSRGAACAGCIRGHNSVRQCSKL